MNLPPKAHVRLVMAVSFCSFGFHSPAFTVISSSKVPIMCSSILSSADGFGSGAAGTGAAHIQAATARSEEWNMRMPQGRGESIVPFGQTLHTLRVDVLS